MEPKTHGLTIPVSGVDGPNLGPCKSNPARHRTHPSVCDGNQNPRADDPCFGCRWPERGFQLTVDFELEDGERVT